MDDPSKTFPRFAMDKATSVLAALDAGKLPSTQQLAQFIDWLDKVGITSVTPENLTSRGQVLAGRVREILDAYKQLLADKNSLFFVFCFCFCFPICYILK